MSKRNSCFVVCSLWASKNHHHWFRRKLSKSRPLKNWKSGAGQLGNKDCTVRCKRCATSEPERITRGAWRALLEARRLLGHRGGERGPHPVHGYHLRPVAAVRRRHVHRSGGGCEGGSWRLPGGHLCLRRIGFYLKFSTKKERTFREKRSELHFFWGSKATIICTKLPVTFIDVFEEFNLQSSLLDSIVLFFFKWQDGFLHKPSRWSTKTSGIHASSAENERYTGQR